VTPVQESKLSLDGPKPTDQAMPCCPVHSGPDLSGCAQLKLANHRGTQTTRRTRDSRAETKPSVESYLASALGTRQIFFFLF
jgi:hypothetical protein